MSDNNNFTTALGFKDFIYNEGREKIKTYFNGNEEKTNKFIEIANRVCIGENLYRANAPANYYKTLWSAIESIAELDLKPGKTADHVGLIVDSNNNIQLRVTYKGWLDVCYRNPNIVAIFAECVRKGDKYQDKGPFAIPDHIRSNEPGEIIGAYAICSFSNGLILCEYTNKKDIDEMRGCAAFDAIWKKWEGEMSKIRPLRRLTKKLPRHDGIEKLEQIDNQFFNLERKQIPKLNKVQAALEANQ